jgi:anti-sigma28 factor (negative regulator of flagellin synthesis)
MRISALRELLNPEFKKVDSAKKTEPAKPKAGASPDRTDLSQSGQRLSETKAQVDIIAAQLNNQPEIRPEKVAEAKQKIIDGFYDTPEFVDKLADKLAQEFGVKKP